MLAAEGLPSTVVVDLGMSSNDSCEVGVSLVARPAEFEERTVSNAGFQAIVATGDDTAMAVAIAMGATGLQPAGIYEPGVVETELVGASHAGFTLVRNRVRMEIRPP